MDKFYKNTQQMTMEQRGDYFKNDKELLEKHKKGVSNKECHSEVLEEVETHFVCFVRKGNFLTKDDKFYELDGQNDSPLCHGNSSSGTFLKDVA